MRDDYPKFREQNATILVVTQHSSKKMQSYWSEERLPYLGVPDEGKRLRTLYRQQWKALKLGLMPALFIIDTAGVIRYAHYSESMSDIPTNQQVLESLSQLP